MTVRERKRDSETDIQTGRPQDWQAGKKVKELKDVHTVTARERVGRYTTVENTPQHTQSHTDRFIGIQTYGRTRRHIP